MVLLGHLHTHEFAVGGTTDQVGNPWALDRTAGGSSGGSGAALAARMTPAATGTDTAGSLRIPSALCGTSTIKPTHGTTSLRGVVPLAPSFDCAGPMARTVEDCALLLAAMAGADRAARPGDAARGATGDLAAAIAGAARRRRRRGLRPGPRRLPGPRGRARRCRLPPEVDLDVGRDYLDILYAELAAWHRRFADRRERYRPALREWVEQGEQSGQLGDRLRGGSGTPARGDRGLGRLDRRAPDRRDHRADRAGGRLGTGRRLRARRQRRRADRPHALLELDRLPGGCAAGRRRDANRAFRSASR